MVRLSETMAAKRNKASDGRLTVKFTNEDRDLLDRLMAARAGDMSQTGGPALSLTVVSYLRWLLQRDARELGLPVGSDHPATRGRSERR